MNLIKRFKIYKNKEGRTMKTLISYLTIFALFLTSCTTTYHSSTEPVPYDDVYYTAEKIPATPPANEAVVVSEYSDTDAYLDEYYSQGEYVSEEGLYDVYDPAASESETYTDENGTTYVTNNYYGDYYDYTGRINRFYRPYGASGYYSGCYADPYYYGSGFSFSIGFGWGWGSCGWGWPYYGYGCGYPYYGWGWGYPYYGWGGSSYWNGYWNGYWDGYYYGGGGYPESYSSYYGPRNSIEGGNSTGNPGRSYGTTGDGSGSIVAGRRPGSGSETSTRSGTVAANKTVEARTPGTKSVKAGPGRTVAVGSAVEKSPAEKTYVSRDKVPASGSVAERNKESLLIAKNEPSVTTGTKTRSNVKTTTQEPVAKKTATQQTSTKQTTAVTKQTKPSYTRQATTKDFTQKVPQKTTTTTKTKQNQHIRNLKQRVSLIQEAPANQVTEAILHHHGRRKPEVTQHHLDQAAEVSLLLQGRAVPHLQGQAAEASLLLLDQVHPVEAEEDSWYSFPT